MHVLAVSLTTAFLLLMNSTAAAADFELGVHGGFSSSTLWFQDFGSPWGYRTAGAFGLSAGARLSPGSVLEVGVNYLERGAKGPTAFDEETLRHAEIVLESLSFPVDVRGSFGNARVHPFFALGLEPSVILGSRVHGARYGVAGVLDHYRSPQLAARVAIGIEGSTRHPTPYFELSYSHGLTTFAEDLYEFDFYDRSLAVFGGLRWEWAL